MVSNAGKMLLKNTIQSLELQNKIKEEKEMWSKLKNEKELERNTRHKRHNYEDYNDNKRRETEGGCSGDRKRHKSNNKKDNYWLKKLMTAEEQLSGERWTHNGFKELYEEELASNKSTSDDSSDESNKKRNKKKRKKEKRKHKKKHKRHKKDIKKSKK
ncbi:uncharacterized protein NKAPD1-like [Oppia nitens]|uniref:uncharacterized protein NKAPD1-like n=1 Tax=Oppia nitens TaxID=1686743 RepID=UPI0023D9995C|nr:uncharacterized protein NKAPD1-like [Oppia nitens]